MSVRNITSFFQELGIDSESHDWEELGSCQNAPLNWFFDIYEENKIVAAQVDVMCSTCPVIKECFGAGINEKRSGVWGGFFLNNGKVDPAKNKHKTEALTKMMAARIYE